MLPLSLIHISKELIRRGLDDGTERLRGQLRDTAQHGQRDDFGGDQLGDAEVGGAKRAEHMAERLLGKKKKGTQHTSDTGKGEYFGRHAPPEAARPGDGSVPVSYTHLDVYKRQSIPWEKRNVLFTP